MSAREIVVVRDESKAGEGRESGSRPVSSRDTSRPVSFSGPISRSSSELDGMEIDKGVPHAHSKSGDARKQPPLDASTNRTPTMAMASVALPPPMPVGLPPGVVHDDASAGPIQASQGPNHQSHIASAGLPQQTSPRGAHNTATTPSNLSMRTSSFRSMQSDDSLGRSSLLSPSQSIPTLPPVMVQTSMPQLGTSAAAPAQPISVPSAPSGKSGDKDYDQKWYTMCLELMHNASRGRFALVKQKLAQGAPVTFADYDKRTALHLAAANGSLATVNVLIDAGADVNAQDRWGGTPVRDALAAEHTEVVLRLEEAGAIQESDADGFDAADKPSIELVQFSSQGNLDAVKERVSSGVPVNVCDYDQRTPLHLACTHGHEKVVDFLLLNGASAVAKDRMGRTPVENAVKNGHRHVLEVLKRCASSDPPLHALLTELRSPRNGSTAVPTAPSGTLASPLPIPPLSSTGLPAHDLVPMNGNGHSGAFGISRPKSTPNAEQLERMRTELTAISHSMSMGHIGIASDDFASTSTDATGHHNTDEKDCAAPTPSSQSLPPTPYDMEVRNHDMDAERARLEVEYAIERARLDEEHRAKVESLERKKTVNFHRSAYDSQSAPSVSPQSGVPTMLTPSSQSGSPHMPLAHAVMPGHSGDLPVAATCDESTTLDDAVLKSGANYSSSVDGASSGQQTPRQGMHQGASTVPSNSRRDAADVSHVPVVDVRVPLYDSSGGEHEALQDADSSRPTDVGAAIVEGILVDASRGFTSPSSETQAEHMH